MGSLDTGETRSARALAPEVKAAARPRALVAILTVSWLALVVGSFGILWRYQRTPGESAVAAPSWPTDSAFHPEPGRPVVVQFIHPRCPCSRASLVELEEILAGLPVPPSVLIVFLRPPGLEPGWERAENWQRAKAIPGATVVVDVDGVEAKRWDARTSGQTFVYGADRKLLFSGGITQARGETGDSVGGVSARAALMGIRPSGPQSGVYGCALDDPRPDPTP